MSLPVAEPPQKRSSKPPTLEELFQELEGPLLLYAMKLVQNSETAQDLVQDAFLRLHTRLNDVQQPKAHGFIVLYITLPRITIESITELSHFAKKGEDSGTDRCSAITEPVDEEPLPDERIEHLENIGLAMLSLNKLGSEARDIVRLKFVEELSYKEISERMGLKVGNVGYKLHHALKQLAFELQQNGVT